MVATAKNLNSKLKEKTPPLSSAARSILAKAALTWNATCTDVKFGTLRWSFSPLKARIMLELATASLTDFPEVSGELIRQTTGMYSEIRQLFYKDPAWRTLLVPCHPNRPGFYRIATHSELIIQLRSRLLLADRLKIDR